MLDGLNPRAIPADLAGEVPEVVHHNEPIPLAVVVEKVGAFLDGIPAPISTKWEALQSLLTELEDWALRNEPTFSRRLDPGAGDRPRIGHP